uniref:Ectonucleotide pyrophosphatase/phosphodiesterase family member 5 n=1 Tax=Trichobilharzia regenti TaxID=157069 RepID=A0AA85IYY8_TRIRE|nr:unnamed protein product [Trichobilharzia regenti]
MRQAALLSNQGRYLRYIWWCTVTRVYACLCEYMSPTLGSEYPNTTVILPPKLLVISLDGFRHDYLDRAKERRINISGFEKIWNSGFRIAKVHNEFITRTGPNHISMVTGLHEESHGIIDNVFYDPMLNDTFDLVNEIHAPQSKWYDVGSEPIWVTNQRHGYQSAVYFWPGSDTSIKGYLPSYYHTPYNPEISLTKRIDTIVQSLTSENVTLGLIYYHEPDSQGHISGPDSPEIYNVIRELNHDMEYLLSLIDKQPGLKASLNIILTSDHGMSSVSTNRTIILHDYIDENWYYSPGADHRIVWLLWPKNGISSDDLYKRLVKKHSKMNVYLRENVPNRLHYSNSQRISPLVVYCEPGWMIVKSKESIAEFTKLGDHGYDPNDSEMSPFFLAMGPGFKDMSRSRRTIPSIQMVDIYPLINGSLSRVKHLLRGNNDDTYFSSFLDALTVGVILLCCLTLSLTLVIVACYSSLNYPYLFPHRSRSGYYHPLREQQQHTDEPPLLGEHQNHQHCQPNLLLLQRRYRSNNYQKAIQLEDLKTSTDTRKKLNHKRKLHNVYLNKESIGQTDRQHLLLNYTTDNDNKNHHEVNNSGDIIHNVADVYRGGGVGPHDDDSEEEFEEFNKFSSQYIDDETFINLLRQPNGRYP